MKKRLLALFVTVGMTVSAAFPAHAATYTEDGSATALVTAELESTYQVMLPAVISLTDPDADKSYTGTYKIGAKGNFTDAKKIVCAPTSNSFSMTGAGHTVTASVTQSVTEWVNSSPGAGQKAITVVDASGDYAGYSPVEGSISATIEYAGSYSGNLEFTFSMEDV